MLINPDLKLESHHIRCRCISEVNGRKNLIFVTHLIAECLHGTDMLKESESKKDDKNPAVVIVLLLLNHFDFDLDVTLSLEEFCVWISEFSTVYVAKRVQNAKFIEIDDEKSPMFFMNLRVNSILIATIAVLIEC
jgi:hypothetical protein